MYCQPSLSKSNGSSRVAVLDTIHGAKVIAGEMVARGIEASAFEVYHHTPSVADFDKVAIPVHLWPENPVLVEARSLEKEIVTHHRAVGELLADDLDFHLFEVTGTHSKTSTALLLSRIISMQERVVSHTTRGIELWKLGQSQLLKSDLSITPGNMIHAFKAASSAGADTLISEISLGGTGLADYGILTSFAGDYRIAKGSGWASNAKLQMVSLAKKDMRLIANTDTKVSCDISFGDGGDLCVKPDHICFKGERFPLSLGENIDAESYFVALAASSAAAIAAGLDFETIFSALEGFDGFSGRMKTIEIDGQTIIDNSNSGLTAEGVERTLGYAKGSGKVGLVVGEEAETVCEGMDIPLLIDILTRRREAIDFLVLVGKRLEPYAHNLDAITATDLDAGMDMARKIPKQKKYCILSCVKCFR
jgi:UDP-N-acetylmuramyl pentapeptide synthase